MIDTNPSDATDYRRTWFEMNFWDTQRMFEDVVYYQWLLVFCAGAAHGEYVTSQG